MGRFQTKVLPESLVYQREALPVEKPIAPEKLLTTVININQEQGTLVKLQKSPSRLGPRIPNRD